MRYKTKLKQAKTDAPYLADTGDPAYINSSKSQKVLTKSPRRRIVDRVIKRKDGKMATKAKIQTNYTQRIAVCLLAAGAIFGFADLLDGGLRACVVAALLVGCLFILAIDFNK
jgi:Flp pilus assembly protein TadB